MARGRRSFVSFLCLSLIFLHLSVAHPNGRGHERRQSLELTIEQLEDEASTFNTSVSTDSVGQDLSSLPKPLKDFLQLLGLGLKLFGDALASLLEDKLASSNATAPSVLLTEIPSLASLVPPVSATTPAISTAVTEVLASSWANTSISTSTSKRTSYLTVTTTNTFTVTASRSAATSIPAIASTLPLVKQNALPFEGQNIVQVYAGRYPGITRTIADLESLCASPDIDIITLAGVTEFFSDATARPMPIASFGSLCNETLSMTPTGEGDCAALSGALRTCQTIQKKKLFLAVETGTDATTLYNPREARTLARLLWDMFGAGKAMASGAKLYGGPPLNSLGIVFDGFEFLVNTTTIDDAYFAAFRSTKEKRQDGKVVPFVPPTLPFFDTLFETLRGLFLTGDTSKPYYLSVSLPCTRPSILSKPALHLADFVSIRFMDDVACNINGLAFNNFLTTWGKDIAELGPLASPSSSSVLPTRTTTLQTTRFLTATVAAPLGTAPTRSVTQAFRLANPNQMIDPNVFSIPRYPTLSLSHTLVLNSFPSIDDKVKRQANVDVDPFFILGIPVPSQATQNATTLSGVGSADSGTMSMILTQAKSSIPNFAGVLLWGSVQDMEVGEEDGYVDFIKAELDRPAPGPIMGIVSSEVMAQASMVSALPISPTYWNEVPTPSSPMLPTLTTEYWNETPSPAGLSTSSAEHTWFEAGPNGEILTRTPGWKPSSAPTLVSPFTVSANASITQSLDASVAVSVEASFSQITEDIFSTAVMVATPSVFTDAELPPPLSARASTVTSTMEEIFETTIFRTRSPIGGNSNAIDPWPRPTSGEVVVVLSTRTFTTTVARSTSAVPEIVSASSVLWANSSSVAS